MKPGDRVRVKVRPEVEGTVKSIRGEEIWIEMDTPVKGENEEGEILIVKEGYVTPEQFEQIFDLIEKSDWASIWDDNSN